MPRKKTEDTVQPHTEAKLQFYIRYLERYLRILLLSPQVQKINIYDPFCGSGVYSDGNSGSAVRAVDAIWEAQSCNQENKPVNLHLNDLNPAKVDNLRKILVSRSSAERKFSISYSQLDASELLKNLPPRFARQEKKIRNLIFIDPYGYKTIDCQVLELLARERKTEIILFLPIMDMYRFARKAAQENIDNSLVALQNFIDQLRIDVSVISSAKEYIRAVEMALSFDGDTFATSYAIKNHIGHYYGLFFITSNLYGLEKILEVKWELDPQVGGEFSANPQSDFFLEFDKQEDFAATLESYLASGEKSNLELYKFVLEKGFMPKHANKFLRRWQNEEKLLVYDVAKEKPARKNSFKLSHKEYRSGKNALVYRMHGGQVS